MIQSKSSCKPGCTTKLTGELLVKTDFWAPSQATWMSIFEGRDLDYVVFLFVFCFNYFNLPSDSNVQPGLGITGISFTKL